MKRHVTCSGMMLFDSFRYCIYRRQDPRDKLERVPYESDFEPKLPRKPTVYPEKRTPVRHLFNWPGALILFPSRDRRKSEGQAALYCEICDVVFRNRFENARHLPCPAANRPKLKTRGFADGMQWLKEKAPRFNVQKALTDLDAIVAASCSGDAYRLALEHGYFLSDQGKNEDENQKVFRVAWLAAFVADCRADLIDPHAFHPSDRDKIEKVDGALSHPAPGVRRAMFRAILTAGGWKAVLDKAQASSKFPRPTKEDLEVISKVRRLRSSQRLSEMRKLSPPVLRWLEMDKAHFGRKCKLLLSAPR